MTEKNFEIEETLLILKSEKSNVSGDRRELLDKMESQQKDLTENKSKLAELQDYVQRLGMDRDSNKMEKELFRSKVSEMEQIVNNFTTIHDHLIKKQKKGKQQEEMQNLIQL